MVGNCEGVIVECGKILRGYLWSFWNRKLNLQSTFKSWPIIRFYISTQLNVSVSMTQMAQLMGRWAFSDIGFAPSHEFDFQCWWNFFGVFKFDFHSKNVIFPHPLYNSTHNSLFKGTRTSISTQLPIHWLRRLRVDQTPRRHTRPTVSHRKLPQFRHSCFGPPRSSHNRRL